MGQVRTKSELVDSRHKVQDEIRKLVRGSGVAKKLTATRASNVLAAMKPSERRAVLDIMKKRDKNGKLNYLWLATFLKVLKALKTEENMPQTNR